MQKMKKANSDNSLGCGLVVTENVGNFLLHCVLYTNIRDKYIPKFCTINKKISKETQTEPERPEIVVPHRNTTSGTTKTQVTEKESVASQTQESFTKHMDIGHWTLQ